MFHAHNSLFTVIPVEAVYILAFRLYIVFFCYVTVQIFIKPGCGPCAFSFEFFFSFGLGNAPKHSPCFLVHLCSRLFKSTKQLPFFNAVLLYIVRSEFTLISD